MCASECACVCVCVCVCVRAHVRACVQVCVCALIEHQKMKWLGGTFKISAFLTRNKKYIFIINVFFFF